MYFIINTERTSRHAETTVNCTASHAPSSPARLRPAQFIGEMMGRAASEKDVPVTALRLMLIVIIMLVLLILILLTN